MSIQEKGIHSLNIQKGGAGGGGGGVSQSQHTRKGPFIVLTCIHEKGVYSLNIHKKGIHSRNMQESGNRITASILKQDQTQKGSKERLLIMSRTHNMQNHIQ